MPTNTELDSFSSERSTCLLEMSLDALDRLSPQQTWRLGDFVTAACLLEAAAPKAGNVHPSAMFDDMDFEDFRRSARAIGPVFDRANNQGVGKMVLEAAQTTRKEVGKNTNLGIILLLGPLVVSWNRCSSSNERYYLDALQKNLAAVLSSMSAEDSTAVYEAIALAQPGGIRQVKEMDIRDKPPARLLDAMQLAAAWDDIAKQYVTGFSDVFYLAKQLDAYRQQQHVGWFEALVQVQLERLASHGDSLIARKNDQATVQQVQHLATQALPTISHLSQSSHRSPRGKLPNPPQTNSLIQSPPWQTLDTYLRSDGHRFNPGTTADLLAAATFVSLINEYNDHKFLQPKKRS